MEIKVNIDGTQVSETLSGDSDAARALALIWGFRALDEIPAKKKVVEVRKPADPSSILVQVSGHRDQAAPQA